MSAAQALSAMRNINPLGDGMGTGDAQGISLLCLSTAASALARRTTGNGNDPANDVRSAFLQVRF